MSTEFFFVIPVVWYPCLHDKMLTWLTVCWVDCLAWICCELFFRVILNHQFITLYLSRGWSPVVHFCNSSSLSDIQQSLLPPATSIGMSSLVAIVSFYSIRNINSFSRLSAFLPFICFLQCLLSNEALDFTGFVPFWLVGKGKQCSLFILDFTRN